MTSALLFLLFAASVYSQAVPPRQLKIVTIEAPPFTFKEEKSEGDEGEPAIQGYLVDLLAEFKSRIDFDYELYLVPDGKYGYRSKSGHWLGMVGELVGGQADMALAPLTITTKRQEVVEFGTPYMSAGLVASTQVPKQGEKLRFMDTVELARHDELKYGVLEKGSTFQFFRHSQHPLYEAMGSHMACHEDQLAGSYIEATKRAAEDKDYVFIGEEPMLRFLTGRRPCKVFIVGNPVNLRYYGLAFQKGSDLVSEFNQALLEINDMGIKEKLMAKWWTNECPKPKVCICNDVSSEESHENATALEENMQWFF